MDMIVRFFDFAAQNVIANSIDDMKQDAARDTLSISPMLVLHSKNWEVCDFAPAVACASYAVKH